MVLPISNCISREDRLWPNAKCRADVWIFRLRRKSGHGFKSVWESLISILLDGNTEAAFSAELVTAVSTEIGMGFVPISICWHAMNNNLIPGAALRAVLFKGAGNFVWIVAHCCSPSF